MKNKADIGVIGLAVMGENLILNMEDKGYTVACYNRTTSKVDAFIEGRAKDKNIIGCRSPEELIASLKSPRVIMMMIKAGPAVDATIQQLLPLLDENDILIDGGNSWFKDTERRQKEVEAQGKRYLGIGVSGGEEGALNGPSLMPGGTRSAWDVCEKIFLDIAAKTTEGEPCCAWVGAGGAGHFVKMIHNGIEYGDMQLICEIYDIMKKGLQLSNERMNQIFTSWNQEKLDSYLIEITASILGYKDQDDNYVVDQIMDAAGQKGTGKWTVQEALDLGQPLTLIGEAVFARCLSALKEDRLEAAAILEADPIQPIVESTLPIPHLEEALYASKIVSYAQGFQLMQEAAKTYNWNLDFGSIALMWRGGCVIRSVFLARIKEAYDTNPTLTNLMLSPFFTEALQKAETGWRNSVVSAIQSAIPMPAISSALAYYDAFKSARLPANLLQAQRDYFGAHTYERIDQPRGKHFHTDWTGHGGDTVSSVYA